MEENKRHIDDFLRDELGSYTETPPPAVWEELEKRLDSPTNRKGFDFRKWWWFIPALLFVAGGTFLAAHKWNQKPALPESPAVTDTINNNDNSIVPDNVYRDTTTINNNTEEETRPAVKPADTPVHAQAPANAAPAQAVAGSTTDKQAAAAAGGNSTNNNKTAAANNTQHTITATNSNKSATAKNIGKKTTAGQTTQTTGSTNNEPAVTGNNNVTTATTGTANHESKTAGQQKKKNSHKNNRPATASAAADKNTTGTTTTADVHNTSQQQAKTTKQQKTAANKPKPATTVTAADNNGASGQDAAQSTTDTKKNTTVTAATNGPKKQKPIRSAANGTKNNTAETGKANEPASNIATRPAKNNRQKTSPQPKNETPAIAKHVPAENAVPASKPQAKKSRPAKVQQQPVAAKNEAPAVKKTAKITSNAGSTAVAKTRAQKPAKQTPAAAANNAAERRKTEEAPMQSSPVHENTKDQEYTFKSKTQTKETPKAKDNLDLSDKQAEAEADTAEEKEMDPYASLNPPDDKKKTKLHLEGGIKAAYTYGFNDYALNKISVLPYVQLNINTKLCVALHLGFSYGQMNKTALDGTQSYYNISPSMQTSSVLDSGGGGQLDTFYTYLYTQLRDSFSVKHTISKSLWEVELPVVFKYNLSSSISIFAGPVFTFGKVVQINEDKSQVYSQTIKDSIVHSPNQYTIGYFNNLHQPSGAPDSTYSNKDYQNPASTPMRLGYTVGLSYDAGKRFVVDVSMQQMLTSPNFIPNETIRKVYTQPYVRVSVGFRIFK